MSLDVTQILVLALAGSAGALLQGTVGFGMALFAVPLIVWAGVPLPVTIAAVMTGAAVQMGVGGWRLRDHISWRPVVGVNLCRLLTLPLGWLTLIAVVAAGSGRAKQVVGVMLLLAVLARALVRVRPRQKLHSAWAALAGGFSGYMSGLVGMSGPPIVLWATAHEWSSDRTRVMIWMSMLPLVPINLAGLTYQFGMPVLEGALVGVCIAPLTIVATLTGMRLGAPLSGDRLRTIALVVLALIAGASILEPLIRGGAAMS